MVEMIEEAGVKVYRIPWCADQLSAAIRSAAPCWKANQAAAPCWRRMWSMPPATVTSSCARRCIRAPLSQHWARIGVGNLDRVDAGKAAGSPKPKHLGSPIPCQG
jgi:hypothetical protein